MEKNMRTDTQRIEKYRRKLKGDVAKRRTDDYEKHQKKLFALSIVDQVRIEREIKKIVGSTVSIVNLPYYIIYGKEIHKLSKKYQSDILANELEILQEKWRARGLEGELLDKVKLFYFPEIAIAKVFKLDWSLLDGEDLLS